MEKQELENIRKVLETGWDAKTTFETQPMPTDTISQGQCYVTARTLSNKYGWALVRYKKDGWNHYWNVLLDGTEVDLTSDQCGGDGIYPTDEYRGKGKKMLFKPLVNVKSPNKRLKLFLNRIWYKLPSIHSPDSSSVVSLGDD